MQLLLKDTPVLDIQDNGLLTILDFARLPFALRKQDISLADFMEWAVARTLPVGRSHAKEILNALRLSQSNRYAVCKACRGLSLEDSYWLRQEGDEKTWAEVNLFCNPLSLYITEVSLSGQSIRHLVKAPEKERLHTPELTAQGASAKAWVRQDGKLFLHKIGKQEIPADEILTALGIPHIHYERSGLAETGDFLTEDRMAWINGVGEVLVCSELFTSEDIALVTFEDFRICCENYGVNAYERAMETDRKAYLQMQIADYLLNNNDRHEQNWGFLMDNKSGRLTGACPLFDHDHAFAEYETVWSQTTEEPMTLFEAAVIAQRELRMNFDVLKQMEKPELLAETEWKKVLARAERLR